MNLSSEVTAVSGIGEKLAEKLKKAGIYTLRDFLYFLPRDYENFQSTVKICDLRPGKVMVRGKISDLETTATRRRGLSITSGTISDETGSLRVVWFNQPYRAKQFDGNRDYYFTGTYDLKNGRYQLTSPSATLAKDADSAGSDLNPIYRAISGIPSVKLVQLFENFRENFAFIPDILPGALEGDNLEGLNLPDFVYPGARADALFKTHFPENSAEIGEARRYLAYEELFELLLASNLSKQENRKLKSEKLPFNANNTKKVISSLPFKLTDAQRQATWDILQDLDKSTPMNRLLQGDVGSGKTVVAAISAMQAISSGFQVALLAPTAILALQHAEGLDKLLGPLGVKIALLVGSTKRKDLVKRQIEQGNVDLIIGTHALITEDLVFNRLAYCIIDEQHRFGVNQRQKLLGKTAHNVVKNPDGVMAPHLLSMTATPIPRSLQLTVFGDLDVSVINQLPAGRQPIFTSVIKETDQKEVLYPKIREEVKKGHQVYWICRKIEEGKHNDSSSVKRQTTKLQGIFPELRIEHLHGKMKPEEKDAIMERFAEGKIDLLVSTTVVEVGVNVPNATLMVIMDAEGYGLAQLHQLRGRVGRGSAESFCYLISTSETSSKRLQAMEKSTDGFYLAEMDLKIRGPGEIYGSLQHGALDLQIASLSDTALISQASRHAKAIAKIFEQDHSAMLKYKELGESISHYQQLTTLN
ncbi:ATP-dependent DNA helicase RecG [Candidatus Saccharibacteria bacterium]|nr:ATP-dependent DNA helicase RecG [Candidatus Saccharibacteria bacterium]